MIGKESDTWEEDPDDVGIKLEFPQSELLARRLADVRSILASSSKFLPDRHFCEARSWGGEPHPRLGCGERLRLGYRPCIKEFPQNLSWKSKLITQST